MEFIEHKLDEERLVIELKTVETLTELQDFIDLLGNAFYLGAVGVIVKSEHLPEHFFELKTKLAGEILQKFSNYRQRMAIVGDFENIESKSLRDFIRESNELGRIVFVESLDKALTKLSKVN